MLIRRADVSGVGLADVRVENGRITDIGTAVRRPGELVIEANGGALLPGLHDHHIHLSALAARASSVHCGPPEVPDEAALAARLAIPGNGWLRGIGYHESVMGLPDARELDRVQADRPLRIQHRSGRLWLLNSAGLEQLLSRANPPPGLERGPDGFTGRLYDADAWLSQALASEPPDLRAVSTELARHGISGVTDMSPRNGPGMAAHFAAQMEEGTLAQHCIVAGALALAQAEPGPWQLGPAKLHLLESDLPEFDGTVGFIAAAHGQGRGVAVHCTTEVELVFALAALEAAGVRSGDRIEHASVASLELVDRMAADGLAVCVQPHIVRERGDRYLQDVEPRYQPDLYRLASLAEAGLTLCGASDAPFGSADPWHAMRAAVERTTLGGLTISADEALSPEAALRLYLADPNELSRQRRIAVGEAADLCLLGRPWAEARARLSSDDVRATVIAGRLVHDSVDQPPG